MNIFPFFGISRVCPSLTDNIFLHFVILAAISSSLLPFGGLKIQGKVKTIGGNFSLP
jgi:hypothetical protein